MVRLLISVEKYHLRSFFLDGSQQKLRGVLAKFGNGKYLFITEFSAALSGHLCLYFHPNFTVTVLKTCSPLLATGFLWQLELFPYHTVFLKNL